MSRLGNIYIKMGEPEGEITGCCDLSEWAAGVIEDIQTAQAQVAPGDIRALKHRIHELEGEVIGYKRILDGQGKAEPVAIAHVGNLDHGPFEITPTAHGCDHLKQGDKLYIQAADQDMRKYNDIHQATVEPVKDLNDLLVGKLVSMDVSTGEHDAYHRVFGTVCEVMLQSCGAAEDTILAIEDSRNFQDAVEPEHKRRLPVSASAGIQRPKNRSRSMDTQQTVVTPVAWMHDQDGRVDVIHDKVKALWLRMGQPDGFYREKVPCKVEHYTIPLFAPPPEQEAAQAAQAQIAVEPVASIRCWTKNGEGHSEVVDWLDAIESLPDGEHLLYTAPPDTEALRTAAQAGLEALEISKAPVWTRSQCEFIEYAISLLRAALEKEIGE